MGKTVFDDISEENIITQKRKTVLGKKSRDQGMSDVSSEEETNVVKEIPSVQDPLAVSLNNLGQNMLEGFKLMKNSFDNLGKNLAKDLGHQMSERLDPIVEYISCGMPQEDEFEDDENDKESGKDYENDSDEEFFDEISGENTSGEKIGPNVKPQLAKIMDDILQSKMSNEAAKEKEDKYPRPENVKFAAVPKTNSPVWDAIRLETKRSDLKVQNVQKNVLKSSLPIAQVIEELYKHRNEPDQIDVKSIITTLTDSVRFLGSANVQCNKIRKELIKKDLPRNMKGLCRESEDVSADLLFGTDLKTKIKEVSELNKIRGKFNPNNFGNRGGYRGRGKFPKRGNFNRAQRKYNPMGKPNFYNHNNAAKNGGSSKAAHSNKA